MQIHASKPKHTCWNPLVWPKSASSEQQSGPRTPVQSVGLLFLSSHLRFISNGCMANAQSAGLLFDSWCYLDLFHSLTAICVCVREKERFIDFECPLHHNQPSLRHHSHLFHVLGAAADGAVSLTNYGSLCFSENQSLHQQLQPKVFVIII